MTTEIETQDQLFARLAPLLEGMRGTRAIRLETMAAIYLCDDIGPAAATVRADLRALFNTCEVSVVNLAALVKMLAPFVVADTPVPMLLACPTCHAQHIDEGGWATRPHRTHLCSACGATWRPALVHTVGVRELVP